MNVVNNYVKMKKNQLNGMQNGTRTLHMKDNKVLRQIKKLVSLLDDFHLINQIVFFTCYSVQTMLIRFFVANSLKIWFKNMVLPHVTICQTVANQYTYTQIYTIKVI